MICWLIIALGACGGDSAKEADTSSEPTKDDTSQQETLGLLMAAGEATVVSKTWQGQETLSVTADRGQGEVSCAVTYPVTSVAPRDDCDLCVWAFDLEAGPAELAVGDQSGCLALGIDAETIAGTPLAYGFALEYLGHANALMSPVDGTWQPIAFANWSESSSTVSYEWEQGLVEYP